MSDLPNKVKGYQLLNAEKVERALFGQPVNGGTKGGIAKEDGSYDDDALLAEYDRTGGLIRKNGDRVKTGSFYDFKKKAPREKPEIVFVFNVNRQEIEVKAGKPVPGIVQAVKEARIAGQQDEAGRKKKVGKKK